MKIIAASDKRHFIVTANEDELAQILGHRSKYAMHGEFEVGQTIGVTSIYNTADAIRGAREKVKDQAKSLQKIVDSLSDVDVVEINDL